MSDSANRDQIEDVLLDYCERVDAGDVEGVLDLFTPDAVIDIGYGGTVTGRDALRTFFADRLIATYSATNHHLGNIRIRPAEDGRTATAQCYIHAWHERLDGSQAQIWGRYIDDLVHDGDRWLLAKRTIRAAGSAGFAQNAQGRGPFQRIDRAGREA